MRILALLCAAVGAFQLPAQTTVSLSAATPIGALTSANGSAATFQGIPQGRAIGASPNNVFLFTSQSAGGSLSATTIIYPTLGTQGGAGFNFFERANAAGNAANAAGSSASTAATGATFGPHAVLATFSAAPGTVGAVKVSWRNNAATAGSANAVVDIGNDGIVEVNQSGPQEFSFPVTIPLSGQIVVSVGNECLSNGTGSTATEYTWTEMWVGFQPDLTATCTFTNYGTGCGGAQAAGTEIVIGNTRSVFMLATGCYPNSIAAVAVGGRQANLPLFNGCSLLCDAVDISLVSSDGAGNATKSWSIPTTMVITQFVQFLPVADQNGALVLRTSNGVRVDCIR